MEPRIKRYFWEQQGCHSRLSDGGSMYEVILLIGSSIAQKDLVDTGIRGITVFSYPHRGDWNDDGTPVGRFWDRDSAPATIDWVWLYRGLAYPTSEEAVAAWDRDHLPALV